MQLHIYTHSTVTNQRLFLSKNTFFKIIPKSFVSAIFSSEIRRDFNCKKGILCLGILLEQICLSQYNEANDLQI